MFTERIIMKARLLVLVCLAALAVGCAPNYEGVSARLEMAVMNGEITQVQAEEMMAALAKTRFAERMELLDGGDLAARAKSVGEGLKAAVDAGTITEDEAWAKWEAFKRDDFGPMLKASVESGKMTREQAAELWWQVNKAELGERLAGAVARGDMTEEEAKAKWAQIEQREAGMRIRIAVAKGEMTPEEARAKWAEMTSECDGDDSECARGEKREGECDRDEMSRQQFSQIAKRLRAKVESGEMSEEDARKHMMNLRKRTAREREECNDRDDCEADGGRKRKPDGDCKRDAAEAGCEKDDAACDKNADE
jgi:polyhydroxyalkanoate synthesis regulator phasin